MRRMEKKMETTMLRRDAWPRVALKSWVGFSPSQGASFQGVQEQAGQK